MTSNKVRIGLSIFAFTFLVSRLLPHQATAADSRFDVHWKLPSITENEKRLAEWYNSQPLSGVARQTALQEFSDQVLGGTEQLTALVRSLATFDPRAQALLLALEPTPPQVSADDVAWLESAESNRFDVRHLRLYYARALNESRRYDEALLWLQDIKPADVMCPEVLLFQRAVAHHQLVQAEEAQDAIDELLRCDSPMSARYVRLATMMQADLEPLETDTLDHIGRRMADVERRLQLGEANEQTSEVESAIVASLDKLIKEAEDQQQKQMQNQQSAQKSPMPSSTPMEESHIADLKGPGKVDPRKLGEETQWGNLPPQERERIMQQLGRDFPAHYREVVEEYFRRLASEQEKPVDRP